MFPAPGSALWRRIVFAATLGVLGVGCAWPAAQKGEVKQINLEPTGDWIDTGIDCGPGAKLRFTVTGTVQYSDSNATGPEGLPRGWKDLLRVMPVNSAGRGAALGRVGDAGYSEPFVIGSSLDYTVGDAGRLYLAVNQPSGDSGTGNFMVKVEVLDAGKAGAEAPTTQISQLKTVKEFDGITAATLAKIPRRVKDSQGNEGDIVNFLILGPQQDVLKMFLTAGWVQVDRTVGDAVLHGLLATLSKDAYIQMPMSTLELFGRPQDYGLAHAEPFAVVARRNHLRLWKAPFQVNGRELWAGAATHDMGFERDQRNGGVTHHIDPDVDQERSYVGETLLSTGMIKSIALMMPANPVLTAKTATGGSFHSDGRILVMDMAERKTASDAAAKFSSLFCSVFEEEKPDEGTFGPCQDYIAGPSAARVDLKPISTDYRVLIVPGVLSLCASSAPAFEQGQAHLKQKHGIEASLLPVPNASCEANGEIIADYLKKHAGGKKFLVFGYSKGGPDVETALETDPEAAKHVAAFITVAGAVGGSPIADVMPLAAKRWIDALHMGSCQGDLTAAFQSLKNDTRHAFESRHPAPAVRSYSIAAVSDSTNTSKALAETWRLLSVYNQPQDSQLLAPDTLVPGATDLGQARADHFAVALPFENLNDSSIQSLVNHNHFPRTALLEALVRYVTEDLEGR
jgi:hypothetical protein